MLLPRCDDGMFNYTIRLIVQRIANHPVPAAIEDNVVEYLYNVTCNTELFDDSTPTVTTTTQLPPSPPISSTVCSALKDAGGKGKGYHGDNCYSTQENDLLFLVMGIICFMVVFILLWHVGIALAVTLKERKKRRELKRGEISPM